MNVSVEQKTPQQHVVKVKRLETWAKLPVQSDELASGFDLYLHEVDTTMIHKTDGTVTWYRTGLAMEPPAQSYFLLYPRSSLSKTDYWLANGVGVLDFSFRNEVLVALRTYPAPFKPKPLDLPGRYVQIIPTPLLAPHFKFEEAEELQSTQRTGGFGSTGLK